MQTISVSTADLPKHIANMLAPCRHVTVYLTDSVEIGSQQWDGGSQDIYTIASLDNADMVKPVEDSRPWPMNMGPLGKTAIPPRFVIIRTGTFCGRTATPVIYARASDISPQIEKPVPTLSHLEKQVLYCLSAYNSSGRARFRDDFRVSKVIWDSVIASLSSKGLATPRAAITVEGRNAARGIDSMIVNPYSSLSKE